MTSQTNIRARRDLSTYPSISFSLLFLTDVTKAQEFSKRWGEFKGSRFELFNVNQMEEDYCNVM